MKPDVQNFGIGFKIWTGIEELHPETRIWETHTPYYDKRNGVKNLRKSICGFKALNFLFKKGHVSKY